MSDDNAVILLVEDDPIDVQLFQRELARVEIEATVQHASDGGKALEILRGARPERLVVVLDLNMPGLNGHDFLEAVRDDPSLHRSIVFVLTSSAHPRDVELAYDQHVAGYFNKADIKVVMAALEPYLRTVSFPPAG